MITQHLHNIMQPVERNRILGGVAYNEIVRPERYHRPRGYLDSILLHIAIPGTEQTQDCLIASVNRQIDNLLDTGHIHYICCSIILLIGLSKIPDALTE